MIEVHGDVADGFGTVADAFRRNFEARGEVGAALAVYRGTERIVDIWAGHRDRKRTRAWDRDTMVPVFSSTKGMAAFAIAAAVSAGVLDYDTPVAHYWPEFAQHGKADVSVADLIDHRGGLAAIDTRLTLSDLYDLDALAVVLARQKPAWPPGTKHAYHAISYGLFVNELIRRADPAHRSIGVYFADEIASPMGSVFYIGLPETVSMDNIAALTATGPWNLVRHERDLSPRMGLALMNVTSMAHRALTNPRIGLLANASRHAFLAPEIAGSNGVGTVRSLAQVYGAAATGTGALPISTAVLDLIAEPARRRPEPDEVLQTVTSYHLGFRKSHPGFAFGSEGDRAYGTTGLGGSFGFADPESGIGFAYAPNRLGLAVLDDARSRALRTELFRVLSL